MPESNAIMFHQKIEYDLTETSDNKISLTDLYPEKKKRKNRRK